MPELISITNLSKVYAMGDIEVHALRSVNLKINQGEFVAIMGMSGSGKSSLMNIIGCLDLPSAGEYFFLSRRMNTCTRNELAEIRNRSIGFVFQNFSLLARTTALENVELPMLYCRERRGENPVDIAKTSLKKVGLGERMHHLPNQLSGGQQQRVAIARAIVNDPPLILADEPTGALDTGTSIEVMNLFTSLHKAGKTIILVTHEIEIAQFAERLITMRDGCIISDGPAGES
ncbi:MAG TPA: ABC transporter ATP-binding protein [Chitinispirillaceae bacterium]|nr:ABC transporter ATP-binding protein [Chitinispirillaceae bacterium]